MPPFRSPSLAASLLAFVAFSAFIEYGCADGTSGDASAADGADAGPAADDDTTGTATKDSSTGGDDDDDDTSSKKDATADATAQEDAGLTCEGGVCAPTNGLVAYYAFGGNANDSSPSKAHGTTSGSVTSINDRFGNANSAYLFNGGAASVTAPNTHLPTGNASRTLAVWAKATALDDYNCAANWGSSSTGMRFGLSLKNGTPFFTAQKDDLLSTNGAIDNKWHLLVATYDNTNNQLTLYVDGANVATKVYSSDLSTTGDPLVIGQKVAPTGGENWYGMLDDVRVYNRVLTPNELDALLHENGY